MAFFFILTWDPIVRVIDHRRRAWRSVGVDELRRAARDGRAGRFSGYEGWERSWARGRSRWTSQPACSGAVPTSIYMAAVFAYPTSWRARWLGTAIGIGVIQLVNIFRVCALFLIGLYFRRSSTIRTCTSPRRWSSASRSRCGSTGRRGSPMRPRINPWIVPGAAARLLRAHLFRLAALGTLLRAVPAARGAGRRCGSPSSPPTRSGSIPPSC